MLGLMKSWAAISRFVLPSVERREIWASCQRQRALLPHEIRDLVLDDQRLRNALCWFAFDC